MIVTLHVLLCYVVFFLWQLYVFLYPLWSPHPVRGFTSVHTVCCFKHTSMRAINIWTENFHWPEVNILPTSSLADHDGWYIERGFFLNIPVPFPGSLLFKNKALDVSIILDVFCKAFDALLLEIFYLFKTWWCAAFRSFSINLAWYVIRHICRWN